MLKTEGRFAANGKQQKITIHCCKEQLITHIAINSTVNTAGGVQQRPVCRSARLISRPSGRRAGPTGRRREVRSRWQQRNEEYNCLEIKKKLLVAVQPDESCDGAWRELAACLWDKRIYKAGVWRLLLLCNIIITANSVFSCISMQLMRLHELPA